MNRTAKCPIRGSVFNDLTGDALAEFVSPAVQYSWALDEERVIEPEPTGWQNVSSATHLCNAFALDLDDEAPGQILVGNKIIEWDGSLRCTIDSGDGMSWPADFDGDGDVDILLMNGWELVLAETNRRVLRRANTREAFGSSNVFPRTGFGETPSVAPLLDRVGVDLIWAFNTDAGSRLAVIDADLQVHDLRELETGYSNWFGAVADLDGNGLYEYFYGDDYVDPRTGKVLGSLGLAHGGWVQAVADIDRDGHAEIVAGACSDSERCELDLDIVAFEGDSLAMAPTNWSIAADDRSGLEYDDGTAVPAGEYPGPDEFNTINVPEFSARRVGYGVDLEVAFADVCTDSCWKYELPVHITVANRGVTDLVHPVEIRLIGELAGTEEVLDTVVVPSLAAGVRTQALAMEVAPAWTRSTSLRLEVTPVGRPLWTCDGSLPVTVFEGATCAGGG